MKLTRRQNLALMGAAAATLALPKGAAAQEGTVHEVQMLNKHPDSNERQVFYPDIVRAMPGDTIRFLPEDRGHNSAVNEDLMPEGGETWDGQINEEVEVTVTTEGAYAYYCTPHRTAGMVGLLLVGDVSGNYEDVKEGRFRGRARQRYEDIFARADELLASEGA